MEIPLPQIFPGVAGKVITALQCLVIASSYANEMNPKTRAQYSKFSQASATTSKKATWSSRFGMMVIYTPAFIASVVLLALGANGVEMAPLPSLAAVFSAIHFAKRCLEVLFLHKYSGRTDIATPVSISVFYTLVATLVAYAAGSRGDIEREDETAIPRMMVGTALFSVGILGNFYHHYLLARLRSSSASNKAKYVAPKGGLFHFVAAPHYLFELIGWLGIAIVSHQLNAYLLFGGMSSYLGGRSYAQNDFNKRKFDEKEWPHSRKNLIPFVY